MPTGYTAKLMESGQTFPEFVMLCARAFGACIEMRDDSMDAPIPDEFKPSDYYAKALEESKRQLEMLNDMNEAEKMVFGSSRRSSAIKSGTEYLARCTLENERIDTMMTSVSKWIPPTPEHEGIKKFMLEQLEISRHDLEYCKNSLAQAESLEPMDYYTSAVSEAQRGVESYLIRLQEDIDRAKHRSEWVRELRKSIS